MAESVFLEDPDCPTLVVNKQSKQNKASLLHCTRTAFLGHTQTRVDLRVAPLLL
jgi:hypothetical protein